MTFELEGTKNEDYVDNISVSNINYRDTLYGNSVDDVQSSYEVIPSTFVNPNTIRSLLIIITPLLAFLIALLIYKKRSKKING